MGEEKEGIMKLSGYDLNSTDRSTGFVKIEDLGNAQQVTVDTDRLGRVVAFLKTMREMGFEQTVITVQKGQPLILGGKNIGVGIAIMLEIE